MLHHRLAGAEGAGHGGGTALGDGEHGVDDTLAGLQGSLRRELLLIGAAYADRPFLHHGQLPYLAVCGADTGDGLGNVVLPGLCQPFHRTGQAVGNHDLVQHDLRLGNGAQYVTGRHTVADPGHGSELPQLLPVQRRHLDAAGDVGAHTAHDLLQRTLDAVINILDQAGTQLHAQRRAGGDHIRAGAEARGLLVYLNGSPVTGHIQDLSDQLLLAYAHHVRHAGVRHAVGHHQRAGDFNDLTHLFAPFRKYPRPRRVPLPLAVRGRPALTSRPCRGSRSRRA